MRVACGQCGAPYDDGLGFCPRCGATRPQAAAPLVPLHDPRRRRVQMAGVLFVVLGGLVASVAGTAAIYLMAAPHEAQDGVVRGLADVGGGGELNLTVTRDGLPVEATVVVTSVHGFDVANVITNGTTGNVVIDLGNDPAVRVVVESGGLRQNASFVVLAQERYNATLELTGPAPPEWQGIAFQWETILILTWVVTGGFLLLVVSGVAALRVRNYSLAWTAAIPTTLVVGLIAFSVLSIGFLLAFGLLAVGLALIVTGRSAFERPRA